MSDKEDEQSFEELFDEMAGDVPPAPVEMSIPDEGDADVQLRETQEEEKEEGQGQGQGLESEPEPEPEPEEPSDPNEIIESLRQENRDLTHRYNSDLGEQNAHQRKIKIKSKLLLSFRSRLVSLSLQRQTRYRRITLILQKEQKRLFHPNWTLLMKR